MKERHIKRTNKVVFIIQLVSFIFITVGVASQLAMSDLPPICAIIPMILNVIVFIGGIVIRKVDRDSDKYPKFFGFGFTIVYVFMLLMTNTNTTYPYMIPVLIILIMIMDKKLVLVCSTIFGVTNLIRVIMTMASAEDPSAAIEGCMVEIIITVLIIVAVNQSIRLFIRYHEESMLEITSMMDDNSRTTDKIKDVASGIGDSTTAAVDDVAQATELSKSVNDAMNAISDGVQMVVDSINQQTEQTRAIQLTIDEAHIQTGSIVDLMKEIGEALNEGAGAMSDLMNTVEGSISEINEMEKSAEQLKLKSEEARGIVDVIVGISNQTNLLALNASIEAARAGETGKGFAVVADEIRNLAEQTRQETENITAILNELISNANNVTEKVKQNVELTTSESDYANNAEAQFDNIRTKSEALAENIKIVENQINELKDANDVIVDSVSNLSASSEEIGASVEEACTISERNVEIVTAFAGTIEMISDSIDDLRS